MSFCCKTQTTLGEKLAKISKSKYEWLTEIDTMNIQARLDPEILEAARKAAKSDGVTLSEYLRNLLRENEGGNRKGSEENGTGVTPDPGSR